VRAAALVTPNADEVSALLGRAVRTSEEGRAAAEDLVRAGARAALVKGGHLDGERAVDWFATARGVVPIARKRRATPPLHGTGCTLSSLIAGRLAVRPGRGRATEEELLSAVRWARAALDRALRSPVAVGRGARLLEVAR
jgi:hydroxymethylpyrimidine/phosphomethylpyrimidine kinase